MWVEYAKEPLAVGTRRPRFAWDVPLRGRCRRQSAYRVLVATREALLEPGQADLWDSGRVESGQSVNVVYDGAELTSDTDCFWTVRIWDEQGRDVGLRPMARFATAFLDEADWRAQWIGLGDPDEPFSDPAAVQQGRLPPEIQAFEPDLRAPQLRKAFVLDQPVRRARAFVCGLGLSELRLNGGKVGADVLATPRTDFRKRVLYSVHDVTAQLREGENVVGLLLGNGWFNGAKRYWGWQQQWHGSPRGIVQFEIEFEDGSRHQVVSDGSWRGAWSPITFNCLYDGETYDARLEQDGWDRPAFDDSAWQPARLVASPGGVLRPVEHEPGRVLETIRPVAMKEPEPGVYVYDLGRNITGWVRLSVRDGAAGDLVTLRFGEAMHANGALNASSNNAARQTDRYTLRGGAAELYEPRFTYHGFQFVELTGHPGTPDLDTLTGCFVRTAVALTGSFDCAHEGICRIHRCTLQSQLCNVQMGVPTDDTQRPERLGWGADAWGTAVEALYNLWMPRVYAKWIGDFRDQQDELGCVGMIAPQSGSEEDLVWSAAFLLIPWWQYVHCGDRRILEDNYAALRRYMDYLQRVGVASVSSASSPDVIDRLLWRCGKDGRLPAETERGHLQISQWGDHLATAEGFLSRSNLPLSIATAFYHLDACLMTRIAGILGEDDDAARYADLAEAIRTAFNARFFDANLGYYDTGVQSAQAWALAFGLVPEEHRARVEQYFVRSVGSTQRRLTTGYAGTKYAIQALSLAGRDDLVWKLATATDYPSWGHMLRLGRTTSCERWDGEGGSLNHAPLGAAIDEWFYWGLAGIRPDESAPGFERIVFKPHLPPDLPWARASLQTVRGAIVSEWHQDGARATLNISVPANSTATVHLPTDTADTVTEGGLAVAEAEGVTVLGADGGAAVFAVGSGDYCFAFSVRPARL